MRRYQVRLCMRQRIWSAMRILTRFTIPDLCRVVEGSTVANVQSYISRLYREGYIGKFGTVRRGFTGEFQGYHMIKNIGPTMPVFLKGRHQKNMKNNSKMKKAGQ